MNQTAAELIMTDVVSSPASADNNVEYRVLSQSTKTSYECDDGSDQPKDDIESSEKANSRAEGNSIEESSPKRRRSRRNIHRLAMAHPSSLQFRRMQELFFVEEEASNRRNDDKSDSEEQHISINTTTRTLAGLTLNRVSTSPHIYVIDKFLSSSDVSYLMERAAACKFETSFVDGDDNAITDKTHRTSTFVSFGKQESAKISSIEQRAAAVMGCWGSQTIEPLQLVRYKKGQFFGVHHDLGHLEDDDTVQLPQKSVLMKRRLVTLFCYLNEVEAGGATDFPAAGVSVRPAAGRAVLFCNILASGMPDPRTIHAGLPVEKGVKYGLNIWLCES